MSHRWTGLGLIVVALAIWLVRLPLHHLPLERDEGAYAVIARDWLHGAVPYRDRFDHKPPFVYAAYAPAVVLPGDAVAAIRRWATLWLIGVAWAMAWTARQLWHSDWIALAAALLTGMWGSGLMVQGPTFNTEAIMILPATVALGAALRGSDDSRWWILAGAMATLAVLSKPVGVLIVPALLVGAMLNQRRWCNVSYLTAGAALIVLPLLLYFALAAALPALKLALWDYNLRYAVTSAAQSRLTELWPVWKPLLPLASVALLGGLLYGRRWNRNATVGLLWSVGLIAGAVVSLRPYPHYYMAAVPALTLWAAASLGPIIGSSRDRWRMSRALISVGVIAALCGPPLASVWPLYRQTPAEQVTTIYPTDGLHYFSLSQKVADWIAANTAPDSTLWVWAAEPQLYYLSGKAVPTRFPYDYPLAVLPGARDEVIADLNARPPTVIVTYGGVRPDGISGLQSRFGYTLRANLDGYDIWTLPPP